MEQFNFEVDFHAHHFIVYISVEFNQKFDFPLQNITFVQKS